MLKLATSSLPLPRRFARSARSSTCGERVDLSRSGSDLFFFFAIEQIGVAVHRGRAICRMVKGWRETDTTPPHPKFSGVTGGMYIRFRYAGRSQGHRSTGRVSRRTRVCVAYASSPHHLTCHATTTENCGQGLNPTNLAALHAVCSNSLRCPL